MKSAAYAARYGCILLCCAVNAGPGSENRPTPKQSHHMRQSSMPAAEWRATLDALKAENIMAARRQDESNRSNENASPTPPNSPRWKKEISFLALPLRELQERLVALERNVKK